MVKYYDAFGEPTGNKKSAFVKASDYATLEAEVSRLTALVDEAKVMAKPFADYATLPSFYRLPADAIMTNGSSMVARQVTAGDFFAARAFAEKAGA